MTETVASWGRVGGGAHDVMRFADRSALLAALSSSPRPSLAFGNGRSYGDVCLNIGHGLWAMRGLDRFIAFDRATGTVECEAGVLLKDIVDLALSAGWFLPVTPGTQYATLGGAIANDVHGKNHHRAGTIGEHVESLILARTDGARMECSPQARAEWFAATIGGIGLTGVVVSARLRLRRVPGPWISVRSTAFDSLDGFFELSGTLAQDAEYSVAWIDCQPRSRGDTRGIFFCGDHSARADAAADAKVRRMPIDPPVSLVNAASIKAFNALYFARHRRAQGAAVQDYRSFFYPLDGVLEWNRLYGRRGFYQYQCVLPRRVEADATRELLGRIGSSGIGSFLAVLKAFDERPAVGMLSFPMAGTTVALDFPNASGTLPLFQDLDAIVATAGGRVYLAKDATSSRPLFEQGYPRLAEFARFRDPGIASDMSRRLFGQ